MINEEKKKPQTFLTKELWLQCSVFFRFQLQRGTQLPPADPPGEGPRGVSDDSRRQQVRSRRIQTNGEFVVWEFFQRLSKSAMDYRDFVSISCFPISFDKSDFFAVNWVWCYWIEILNTDTQIALIIRIGNTGLFYSNLAVHCNTLTLSFYNKNVKINFQFCSNPTQSILFNGIVLHNRNE